MFRNVGSQSASDAAQHHTETKASATPPREPKSLSNIGNERQDFSKPYDLMHGRTEGRNLRNFLFAPKSDDNSDQKLFYHFRAAVLSEKHTPVLRSLFEIQLSIIELSTNGKLPQLYVLQKISISYLLFSLCIYIYICVCVYCGPVSSVGIATELRAGRSRIESRWGRDFPPS